MSLEVLRQGDPKDTSSLARPEPRDQASTMANGESTAQVGRDLRSSSQAPLTEIPSPSAWSAERRRHRCGPACTQKDVTRH